MQHFVAALPKHDLPKKSPAAEAVALGLFIGGQLDYGHNLGRVPPSKANFSVGKSVASHFNLSKKSANRIGSGGKFIEFNKSQTSQTKIEDTVTGPAHSHFAIGKILKAKDCFPWMVLRMFASREPCERQDYQWSAG